MKIKSFITGLICFALFSANLQTISAKNILNIQAAPTTQSSYITFPDTRSMQCDISWSRGDGDSCVVFVKQGAGAITNPVNGTNYTASDAWNTKGTQLGASGYYCVYNGPDSYITLTKLNPSTLYTVQIFEYNGGIGTQQYLTTTATDNPLTFTTTALVQSYDLYFYNTGSSQCSIEWTAGDGDSSAVFMKEGTGAATNPVNNTKYNASANWNTKGSQLGASGYYCIYNGSSTDFTVTQLKTNTLYTLQVFDYQGGIGSQQYITTAATENNPDTFRTIAIAPASYIYFSDVQSDQAYIGWSRGGGDSCAVFVKEEPGLLPIQLTEPLTRQAATGAQRARSLEHPAIIAFTTVQMEKSMSRT